jgi:trigger factor
VTDVSIETERLPGSQVGLTIEVPQARVDAAFERVLNRLSQRMRIGGFRPGKAPRALVEARLGPAAIRDEVIESLVPEVVRQALLDRSIEAIDQPRVDVIELERGRPARFSARVSVMPEVTLPDLAGIRVEKPRTEVTDEMVRRRLLELRERLAEVEPVDREVRLGDVVVNDLTVLVEGREVPSESRKAMEVEVKEGTVIPELLAVLPGTAAGGEVVAEVRMPEDHTDPALAGRTAELRMKVLGVKEKRIPELDDDLAKQLSGGEQETAEGLREAVRKDLEEQARRIDELAYEQRVLQEVVDASHVEVPASLVDREVERQLEDLEGRLSSQGLRLDRYLQYLKQSEEQYREQARPDAEARIKVDLVLEEVGRREGIEPSDEEVLAYMQGEVAKDQELSSRFGELAASRAARDYFGHRLRRLKVLESLVRRAQGEGGEPEAPGEAPAEAPADSSEGTEGKAGGP